MDGNRIASSSSVPLDKSTFVQGSDVAGSITLPTTMAPGLYDFKLYYSTTQNNRPIAIECNAGQLRVVGRLAKYNADFDINDVTYLIDLVLGNAGSNEMNIDINDVTGLIDYILGK